ncbi:MAG: NAD(P)-dependent glycerol-3-phosphate dehydrogenase [Phycisphaeraceae bacterium]|nr:MAG: NAD(P)-dependent glycerol-3-phosphate dehydrogenase [Phycisphaeraceae bacterium]
MLNRQPNPPPPTDEPTSVAVLGSGQMGLVCAGVLAGPPDAPFAGRRVVLWSHSADEAGHLIQTRRSDRLPGFTLPTGVEVTPDLPTALRGSTVVVSAVPVQFARDVWRRARGRIEPGAGVVSVAKGIETSTLMRVSEVIADALEEEPGRPIGCLSGPTIAAELAKCLPAAMIAACPDEGFALRIQRLFGTSWLRVYTNSDLVGVEVAGAVKNVIAIAAGIVDGLNAGNNAKSALLARGLAEITRLGVALGARTGTFFGVAGVGDLATTCFSPEGRNRSCGEAIGRGVRLQDHLTATPHVVEGVATCKAVLALASRVGVEMPITAAVHAVLFEGLDPIDAVARLMARDLKPEFVG